MVTRIFRCLFAIFFGFFWMSTAAAALDRYVSTTGSDAGNDCLNPTSPCATVNRAVSVAENDDTIKVARGRYVGSVIIEALFKNMTLQGGWDADFSGRLDRASETVLDGDGGLAVLGLAATVANINLVLENLTFENGAFGLFVYNMGATIALNAKRCVIKNNGPSSEDQNSYEGGGVVLINAGNTDVTILDCEISRNTGAIGGLFFFNQGRGTLSVVNTTVKNNVSISLGVAVSTVQIVPISPRVLGGMGAGGIGIATTEGGSTVIDLQRNIIKENGGFSAGGVFFYSQGSRTQATMTNNMIIDNNSGRSGGGVCVKSQIDGTTRDEITISLVNNTIAGNSASGGSSLGGGVFEESDDVSNRSNVLIKNGIIWGNSASGGGADLALVGVGANVTADYSIIRFVRNDGGHYSSTGVVGSDPLFVNPSSGDYHLIPGSPARGAGIFARWTNLVGSWRYRRVSPPVDFEGDLRPALTQQPCCDVQLGCDMGADQHVMLTGPVGRGAWSFSAEAVPVRSSSHLDSKPFGIGSLAYGGDYLSLRLRLPAFTDAADVYIGLHVPELSPEIFLVTPGGALQPLSEGFTAWRARSAEAIDLMLFGDIPKSALPPGIYNLYLFATSQGTFEIYNSWSTSFVLD